MCFFCLVARTEAKDGPSDSDPELSESSDGRTREAAVDNVGRSGIFGPLVRDDDREPMAGMDDMNAMIQSFAARNAHCCRYCFVKLESENNVCFFLFVEQVYIIRHQFGTLVGVLSFLRRFAQPPDFESNKACSR
jgi:hypothetical protein